MTLRVLLRQGIERNTLNTICLCIGERRGSLHLIIERRCMHTARFQRALLKALQSLARDTKGARRGRRRNNGVAIKRSSLLDLPSSLPSGWYERARYMSPSCQRWRGEISLILGWTRIQAHRVRTVIRGKPRRTREGSIRKIRYVVTPINLIVVSEDQWIQGRIGSVHS